MKVRFSLVALVLLAVVAGAAFWFFSDPAVEGDRAVQPTREEVFSVLECEETYDLPDQPYAYAPMQGGICVMDGQVTRFKSYDTGVAALDGLSDELQVAPEQDNVLVAEDWFVIAPARAVANLEAAFPTLDRASNSQRRALQEGNSGESDPRDFCVVAVTGVIDLRIAGEVEEAKQIAADYSAFFPRSMKAAEGEAKRVVEGDRGRVLKDERDGDAFAYDASLGELVSPLKKHCSEDDREERGGHR